MISLFCCFYIKLYKYSYLCKGYKNVIWSAVKMSFKTLKKVCLFPLCPEPFEIVLLQGHAVYCIGVSLYLCVL